MNKFFKKIIPFLVLCIISMSFPENVFADATVASSATSAGSASPASVTLPGSVASGDLLVFCILEVFDTGTPSTPAGWAIAASIGDGNGATRTICWVKIADGGEGPSVSVTVGAVNTWSAISVRVTGHDAALSITVAPTTNSGTTGSSVAIVTPSITTDAVNNLILRFGSTREASSISDPGGHNTVAEASNGSGATDSTINASSIFQAGIGASGTADMVATGNNREFTAVTIAINSEDDPPADIVNIKVRGRVKVRGNVKFR